MGLFFSVLATIVAVAFVLLWYRHDAEKRRDSFVSLWITMAGTFVGVFLAVFAFDYNTTASETKQLNALISKASHEVKSALAYARVLEFSYSKEVEKVERVLRKDKLEELPTFNALSDNPVLAKYALLQSIRLMSERRNADNLRRLLSEPGQSRDLLRQRLMAYNQQLQHIQGLLVLCSRYVAHDITDADFERLDRELKLANIGWDHSAQPKQTISPTASPVPEE